MKANPFPSRLDSHLDHQVSRGKRPDALTHVEAVLRAVLPPGCPPSWQSIDAARYVNGHPTHEAVADVTMFDGRAGRVRVWSANRAFTVHAHEWLETGDGESCSFEGGKWIRIDPATLEPVAAQREMFPARLNQMEQAA